MNYHENQIQESHRPEGDAAENAIRTDRSMAQTNQRKITMNPLPEEVRTAAELPRGVSIILFRGGKFAISQRLSKLKQPGLWQFPGGRVEFDEVPLAAAQRELCEETGLNLPTYRFTLMGVIGPLSGYSGEKYMGYRYGVTLTAHEEPKRTEPEKCTDWTWVTADALLARDMLQATKEFAFCYALSFLPPLRVGTPYVLQALKNLRQWTYDMIREMDPVGDSDEPCAVNLGHAYVEMADFAIASLAARPTAPGASEMEWPDGEEKSTHFQKAVAPTPATGTPRTDAAIQTSFGTHYVFPDFARTLERELAEARRVCTLEFVAKNEASDALAAAEATIEGQRRNIQNMIDVTLERDALWADLERVSGELKGAKDHADIVRVSMEHLRASRDLWQKRAEDAETADDLESKRADDALAALDAALKRAGEAELHLLSHNLKIGEQHDEIQRLSSRAQPEGDEFDPNAGFDEYIEALHEKSYPMPPDLNWACRVWQEASSYFYRTTPSPRLPDAVVEACARELREEICAAELPRWEKNVRDILRKHLAPPPPTPKGRAGSEARE